MNPRAGRRALIVGCVVALVAAAVVLPTLGSRAWHEFTKTSVTPAAAPANPDARLINLSGNRVNVWKSAWRAVEAHPVKGIGSGTFEFWWNRDGTNGEFLKDAHSIYLESWAETGLPGFLLMLLFLGGLAFAAWRGRRAVATAGGIGVHAGLCGVFAVFLLQAGVDWIWESTAVTVTVLVAVGVAAGAASEPRERGAVTSASAGVAVLLVAILAVMLQLPGLANEANLQASQKAARAGNYRLAVAKATKAIEAESWVASGYGQRGLAYEANGDFDNASRDLEVARKKESTNWRWALLAARVYAEQGDVKNAATALDQAKQLRPYSKALN